MPLLLFAAFSVVCAPWLVRNYHVCGNPFGFSYYAALSGMGISENLVMRSMGILTAGLRPGGIEQKLQRGFDFQLEHLYPLLGLIATAPLFIVALLHPFKRPEAASFRWPLVWMAGGAAFGMAVFGLADGEPQANNIAILFIPLFTFYGLAFLLTLLGRLGDSSHALRVPILLFIYLLSAFPLFNALFQRGDRPPFHWPPYVPPSIASLDRWTKGDEILVSDMPWAVAWYADRKCVWLPASVEGFEYLNDTKLLGRNLTGLYLTPISGDAPFRSEMMKGEFKGWASLILGASRPDGFPLSFGRRLPLNKECIYYSNHEVAPEPGND